MSNTTEKLKDRVVFTGKKPTWQDLVSALKIGENFPVHMSQANSVRSQISSTIKFKFPHMQFRTYKTIEDGVNFIIIERVRRAKKKEKKATRPDKQPSG